MLSDFYSHDGPISFNRPYHSKPDRAAVLRTGRQVKGKQQFLAPCQAKTLEPIKIKFDTRDYVGDVPNWVKFYLNRLNRGAPTYT